jgi:bis(5'-nucleosyl)-tetraphosphatase (symmetrical)
MRDRLWFVGDLVNRGPDSAAALREIPRRAAVTVLGNHDLHLLCVAAGVEARSLARYADTVLEAPDRESCSPGSGTGR